MLIGFRTISASAIAAFHFAGGIAAVKIMVPMPRQIWIGDLQDGAEMK
jgi:hypothetical protein